MADSVISLLMAKIQVRRKAKLLGDFRRNDRQLRCSEALEHPLVQLLNEVSFGTLQTAK